MTGDYKWERVAEDDPHRCQGVGQSGQCPFKAIEDSKYCPRHGGNKAAINAKREAHRLYLWSAYQEKFDFQRNHPRMKTLNEELGVLRMVLQTKLERIKDDQELLMQSNSITQMVGEIGRLTKTIIHLDKLTGMALDENQAKAWINRVCEIISTYITDPDLLAMIGEDMMTAFEDAQKQAANQAVGSWPQ